MKNNDNRSQFFILSSLFILISLNIVLLGISIFKNKDWRTKEQPKNVPSSAVWIGGLDGGYWFDIDSVSKSQARILVFWENTGDVACDTIIDCSSITCNTMSEILNHIDWFDGTTIHFK